MATTGQRIDRSPRLAPSDPTVPLGYATMEYVDNAIPAMLPNANGQGSAFTVGASSQLNASIDTECDLTIDGDIIFL